jgi:hypothetical protein
MLMKKNHKKVLLFFVALVLLIVLLVAGKNYLPLGKLIHRGTLPEKEFVNVQMVNSHAPNSLSYNFEVPPNSPTPSGIYKGIAHSGQYSAKVFGKNSYSFNIERKVAEIGSSHLDAVAVSSWIYIFPTRTEVTSNLVFSITNELGVTVTWKGVNVSGKNLPMGKWFKVSGFFDLSDLHLKPDYKLEFYYWNNSSVDILVDDFYIVFGRAPERKGDSTLADMTLRKPFAPQFNYPPFPFIFAEREETGNQDSPWLVNDGKNKDGMVGPYDRLVVGNFTKNSGGLDELVVINPGKQPELFVFCPGKKSFSGIGVTLAAEVQPFLNAPVLLTGRFTGRGNTELVFLSEQGILLTGFDPVTAPCSETRGKEIALRVIHKGGSGNFSSDLKNTQFLSLDADGDKISELLAVKPDGSWMMMKYTGQGWKMLGKNGGNSVPEWIFNEGKNVLSAGKFTSRFDRDMLLTVTKDKSRNSSRYTLRWFDPATGRFMPFFTGSEGPFGRVIGKDTLGTGDCFFTGNFGINGAFLRYNRNWRFDLKMIAFNDTTYRILGNVDFTGYGKDHNPKYFEILKIIPGDFTAPGKTSLLVIGRNCKKQDGTTGKCIEFEDRPDLPATIQLYSITSSDKK